MAQVYRQMIQDHRPFENLLGALREGREPVGLYGLTPQGISLYAAQLVEELKRPIFLLTYDPVRAKSLYEDLSYFCPQGVHYLPPRELFFFNRDAGSKELLKTRLEALQAAITGDARVIISTYEALSGIYMAPGKVEDYSIHLALGQEVDLEDLKAKLLSLGYEGVSTVEGMGQFALRGGILDIFSPQEEPYRIELFDTEIDSIRTFDINDQRSIESISEVRIFPVQDILLSGEAMDQVAAAMEADLKKARKVDGFKQSRWEEKYRPIVEKLKDHEHITNTDLLLPYIPQKLRGTLLDFFKEEPLIFIDEPKRCVELFQNQEASLYETLSDLVEAGELLEGHLRVQHPSNQIEDLLKPHPLILSNSIIRSYGSFKPRELIDVTMKTVAHFGGHIKTFFEEIDRYRRHHYLIVLLGGGEEKTERLLKHLLDEEYPAKRLPEEGPYSRDFLYVDVGNVHGGLELEHEAFVLINSSELLGQTAKKAPRRKKKTLSLQELTTGDYVVHEIHGIGKFLGTKELTVQGSTKDYLTILYGGGDKLFLPMDQLALIHKYANREDKPPKVHRLSTQSWQRTKARAKRSVEAMAEDLIALYAKRQSQEGFAFSPDSPWQKEFEDSFLYEETRGQLESVEEIKEDMERPVPMDRLLCADVGYGKTEVALRAAFKAILDGKQVAFLVPTTLLAQQHYVTMMERFKDFPIEIAILSRFRTPAEQKRDLEKLRKGQVDLVVGTHRLLSKDVKFADLGLLIIDEEQRFGVRHKEQLKLVKESVDTLTLTATPIPRTLQMSMVGIRDMSVIDEPPQERFPVQTYVVDYNPMMVRGAILKELERGGQVYFVYNRVQSMEKMLQDLRNLVPEASFAMANGQMGERELEDAMFRFVNGEVDVLLCSTIIETGLDVANANTMIVWESNRYGLSQLYQLRGRIGRSNRIAYAYFTYLRDQSISEIAEKRLSAIREFTAFGSGYKIAQRDLEIRGSGNILGESQHGHMDAIGYDLYLKYLRQAVGKLKGEEVVEEEVEAAQVDLSMDAYIPKKYIPDESIRLEMYKKIALMEGQEDLLDITDELLDRFGDPPEPVQQLLEISLIRHMATQVQLSNISDEDDHLLLTLREGAEVELSLVNELVVTFGGDIEFSLTTPVSLKLKVGRAPLKELKKLLEVMDSHNSHKSSEENRI
ncbi:MAG: transcription-repair coupling factor [Tissierellia bacterium]|nr:transcription-repair coupling factor [Tissierellia bacterium]